MESSTGLCNMQKNHCQFVQEGGGSFSGACTMGGVGATPPPPLV